MSRAPDTAELPVQLGGIVDEKFRVERVLGTGGMGVVVEATHLWLRQRVALKFIRREIARDQTSVARFLREARACVQLKNEHVARIMDVGALADDTPYLVMEYLEGQNGDELLRAGGPLPSATAVAYVLQACVGMAEAHALGIVHRDLKPHNLFVTTSASGRPLIKILDFGISKAALAGADDHALTDSRTIVGSPAYMAPEQMESSKDVDARADIWSLGAILFALVTGGPPFHGQTLLQLCARVAAGTREPLDHAALGVPAELVAVIDACLSIAPARRPQDLAELAASLAPFTPGGDALAAEVAETLGATGATPTRPRPRPERATSGALATTVASGTETGEDRSPPRRRSGLIAALAVAAIAVAVAAWVMTRPGERGTPAVAVPPDAAPITRDARPTHDAAVPDATPPPPDAGTAAAAPDAGAPRRDRTPPARRRDAGVNQVLPPPPPPPAPDAGVTDPTRHPRDRRN